MKPLKQQATTRALLFNQFKTKILVVVLCDMQITSPKQFSPKTTPSGY